MYYVYVRYLHYIQIRKSTNVVLLFTLTVRPRDKIGSIQH